MRLDGTEFAYKVMKLFSTRRINTAGEESSFDESFFGLF